ncbi:hypothetical protein BDP27DRAFT_1318265 [Rhodocollybia butyracea]|uniref:Uncharacterized protein n=1 Tax=Rhodocollybia butyracea TaxID=206335 RepID=A0A9P5Q438_9AGAR|nr:hypothetical protein BDP27DRAFT_1318265 [Rhodocollybia butyracea]
MANTDQNSLVSSEPSDTAVKQLESPENVVQSISQLAESSTGTSDSLDSKGSPAISSNNATSSRPTLVQLGAPHPKKYSAFNINKKFLEKNSTSTTTTLTSSKSVKTGGARPAIPNFSSASHPRLVTTKLTATAQLSPSPGPGWSRPSSVTPPAPNGTAPTPSATAPQPRLESHAATASQPKPTWNPAPTANATRADPRTQSDFPTAAEVAQGKLPKEKDSEMAEAHKQARMEEADTFRGVHLDPNAHHWDEMEEDDDNFLNGVIEFGDGRQYKIDTSTDSAPSSLVPEEATEPVSKEDRFADDFDRSWPRTKTSTPTSDHVHHAPPSRIISNNVPPPTLHSGSESSRVLFNERSNRLEPYNRSNATQTPDSRFVRNPPSAPFYGSGNNVQLLQKPAPALAPGESLQRGRGYSGANEKQREREGPRRDGPSQTPLRSPRMGPGPLPTSDPPPDHLRGRRLSNMGPPAIPHHALNRNPSFKDGGRQIPPHLAHPPSPTFEKRQSSRESRYSSTTGRYPSQSPVLSHTIAVTTSPVVPTIEPTPQLSGSALEDVKKDLMQSAAARAKQRRQQEEEEREKEKERARRKAAELEARLEAEKAEKEVASVQEEEVKPKPPPVEESQVTAIIQEAITSAEVAHGVSFGKPPLRKLSSVRVSSALPPAQDAPRPPFPRKQSSFAPPTPSTPSMTTESWRTKPQAPHTPVQQQQSAPQSQLPPPERPRTMSFATPPPSALDQVESFADLEVVDYSDLAKFIGIPDQVEEEEESKASEKEETAPAKSQRPVASDFFEESPSSTAVDSGPWRKAQAASQPNTESTVAPSPKKTSLEGTTAPPVLSTSIPTSPAATKRTQYKEATMSALDDAMSRIKGVLDVMHENDHKPPSSTESPKRPFVSPSLKSGPHRWVPPALREPQPTEVFAMTRAEPPKSPKPAWNAFSVNLPKTSSSSVRDPISRKQLGQFNRYQPLRWDILSFTPPVEGMSRRELSLNDVLFRKAYSYGGHKGKLKYPVSLPKSVLKVNIPSAPTRQLSAGAFGRPTAADGASTWRKPVLQKGTEPELDTTSKSPPPEAEPALVSLTQTPKTKYEETLTESEDISLARLRPRTQPKMPAGSGVAFYRSAVVNAESGSKPSVSFFATSELEIPSKAIAEDAQTIPSGQDLLPATSTPQLSSSSVKPSPVKSSPSSSQYGLPALIHSNGKAESKSSEDSTDRVPLTPPAHHTSPWARSSLGITVKESPVRAPDPEHLKAVWSQTSNQPGLHSVNSLDGITDDLPSVPFTMQDVKSEDGETPPPTTLAPSRMSLHEVTRAFQRVPSSSSIGSHRPTISPPSTTAPVARPTPTAYSSHPPSVQPPNQNVRPPYSYHPSPMMSHSPAPGGMYSHPNPMPNRMPVNGHTPFYSPVWMPPIVPTQSAQNSPMLRQMAPTYPTPSPFPYHHPSPGAPQHMYAMPPPNMPHPQQNGTPNRGRTVSMMSPAAGPAIPMYPGSPALMPMHAGRGGGTPGRNDGPLPHHQHHPSPYAPTGSFAGTRPSW